MRVISTMSKLLRKTAARLLVKGGVVNAKRIPGVSLANTAIEEQSGEQAASITPEVPIDVSSTATTLDSRRVDACLRFDGRNPSFGEGLIIEVRYRNHSKAIEETTHDYLACGYSVAWVDTNVFEKTRLEYAIVELFRDDDRLGYAVRECEQQSD